MRSLDLTGVVWCKSSRSQGNDACVEVAATAAAIAVRDSKNPDGPVLAFDPAAFAAFTAGVKAGTLH